MLVLRLAQARTCRGASALARSQQLAKNRSYHSDCSPSAPPFSSAEEAILSSALRHVPQHGFSRATLTEGAKDAGYLEASSNLFPGGAFDLVNYHLVTQRLSLKNKVQALDQNLSLGARVRALTLSRLRANEPIVDRWQEALALMAVPSNVSPSLAELARLSDEIWFLAGDESVDSSWYTKRASLSAIYSSTELFMTTDTSPGFRETENFLDRRLEELRVVGMSLGAIREWTAFTLQSAVNVARNKGMRI